MKTDSSFPLISQSHELQEDFERLLLTEEAKSSTLASLISEKTTLEKQLNALVNKEPQKVASVFSQKKHDSEVNDLISELHNLQERFEQLTLLEREDTEAAEWKSQKVEIKHKLHIVAIEQQQFQTMLNEKENQQLLTALHEAHEELERSFIAQDIIDAGQRRLNRLLERNPEWWEFDTLEISHSVIDDDYQVAQWRLTDVNLDNRLISELCFRTVLSNGIVGIIIQRADKSMSAPLVRWPIIYAQHKELPCVASRACDAPGSDNVFNVLGASDWNMIKALVVRLIDLLSHPEDSRLPEGLDVDYLKNGLIEFKTILAEWPNVLRYDTIELYDSLEIGDYHSIGIRLKALQLGDCSWADMDYRLATVSEPGNAFDQHPRLEFPEKTSEVLRSWFAESKDERSDRLELRFAQPNMIDTRVWNALDGDDRLTIVCLIASLDTQMMELQQKYLYERSDWQSWRHLGSSIKAILARKSTESQKLQKA
ncbi:Uncharacterized protein AC504_4698 [Pseudomonas syringae pv. maculicola]|nr:Uncharacterized protein AC504_4698 [Pseudomonas syringae pv. maculicola]